MNSSVQENFTSVVALCYAPLSVVCLSVHQATADLLENMPLLQLYSIHSELTNLMVGRFFHILHNIRKKMQNRPTLFQIKEVFLVCSPHPHILSCQTYSVLNWPPHTHPPYTDRDKLPTFPQLGGGD